MLYSLFFTLQRPVPRLINPVHKIVSIESGEEQIRKRRQFFSKTHNRTQVIRTILSIGDYLIWATIKLQVKTSLTEALPLVKLLVLDWILRIDITRAGPKGRLAEPSNFRLVKW